MTGSLAWQGTKMDDTITLNTRILLATKGFHDEAFVHGGYNKAKSTQRSKNKRNMTEVLGHSRQDQMNIYSRLEKLSPSAREAIVHPWNFGM
jgi:hypothetical protein